MAKMTRQLTPALLDVVTEDEESEEAQLALERRESKEFEKEVCASLPLLVVAVSASTISFRLLSYGDLSSLIKRPWSMRSKRECPSTTHLAHPVR